MIVEGDRVTATKALQNGEIPAGSIGIIIDIYDSPPGFEVEFKIGEDYIPVGCHPEEIAPEQRQSQKAS